MHFINCSPCTSVSLLQKDTEKRLKILLISNCLITSIPNRQFEESSSLNVIRKLNSALKSEIEKKGNIEFIREIDNLGVGSTMLKKPPLFESHYSIDSVISSIEDDSIRNCIQKINRYICIKGFDCLVDSITGFDLKYSFVDGSTLKNIQLLKTISGADYCIVNSINGTIRKKSVSAGEKVGVAIATGLISVLSPIGGLIVIPGDETDFKSHTFLLNLNTGRVEWMDGYYAWQLRAVENLDVVYWAQKTFKKFDIQIKVCPEGKSQNEGGLKPL
jgi:hypothetical protein